MPPGLEAKQTEEPVGFEIDKSFGHVAQAAYELEIFQAGEVSIDVSLLGDVAERSSIRLQIVPDTASFKKNLTVIGLEQAGNDLDSGGLAGAVGPDVSDDFTRADTEADVVDGGKTAVAFTERFNLEH